MTIDTDLYQDLMSGVTEAENLDQLAEEERLRLKGEWIEPIPDFEEF